MSEKKCILVADVHIEEVESLIAELEKTYSVVYFSNGRQVRHYVKDKPIDAAILDWKMDIPGFEISTCRKFYGDQIAIFLRNKFPNIPIILRSSSASDFKEKLSTFDIYCHDKMYSDDSILSYLENRL